MKKLILILACLSVPALAQQQFAAYVNPGTGWTPWTAASGSGQVGATPIGVNLFCQASAGAAWSPCTGASGSTYTGTANQIDITGGVISLDPNLIFPGSTNVGTGVTKRLTIPVGSDGFSNGSLGTTSEICVRSAAMFPYTPTRFRMHVRNYKILTSTANTGALNGTGIWIGAPVFAATAPNRYNGSFTATPTNIVGTFALDAAGDDYVSAWVTNTGLITANTPFATAVGINNIGGGGSVTISSDSVNGGYYLGAAASTNCGVAGNPVGSLNGGTYFDIRVEAEYQTTVDPSGTPKVPIVVAIGDSITGDSTGGPNILMSFEGWPGAASLKSKFAVTNLGVASSKTSSWTNSALWFYQRADLTTTPPDAAIISLGINDVNSNLTTASIEANLITIMGILRNTYSIPKIYLATMIPGGYGLPISTTGTINSTAVVTSITTAGLLPGLQISGTGIPASTIIETIDSPTQLTMSANATASTSSLAITLGVAGSYVNTSAQEIVRQQVNEWERSLPNGAAGVFDFDKAVMNPGIPGSAYPNLVTVYPHPNAGGYQVMSDVVKF